MFGGSLGSSPHKTICWLSGSNSTSKAPLHVPKELSEEGCVVALLAMRLDDHIDVSEERKYHDVWNACPPSGT